MSDNPEFPRLYAVIVDYLKSIGSQFSSVPGKGRVDFTACGRQCIYSGQFFILSSGDYIRSNFHYPFFIPEVKQRPLVAELVTRANHHLHLGKFDMNMEEGTVCFQESRELDEAVFSRVTMEKIYVTGLITADRYFSAFMQLLHAGYTPEDAVFHSELDTHADSVEDTPKTKEEPKSKEKAPDSGVRTTTPKPPRKPARKKAGGKHTGQGELPI